MAGASVVHVAITRGMSRLSILGDTVPHVESIDCGSAKHLGMFDEISIACWF